MKILLIDSPSSLLDAMDPPRVFMPLGLLSLGAVLENEGYQVRMYDPKLSASYIRSGDHYYLGDPPPVIRQKIREYSPDVIGISMLFSRDFDNALMIARAAKEVGKPESAE